MEPCLGVSWVLLGCCWVLLGAPGWSWVLLGDAGTGCSWVVLRGPLQNPILKAVKNH